LPGFAVGNCRVAAAGVTGYSKRLVRVSGYVVGVGLVVASVALSLPSSYAILFKSTADPTYNTTAPSGTLTNSGWQYEGSWGSFLGTPVAPLFFIAAHHIGGTTGDVFVLNGFTYHTTAVFDDPNSDLRMWQVAETFPSYAPLYTSVDEVGKHYVVFGRGTQRGPAVIVSGATNGWQWGASDGIERWGENDVATTVTGGATLGDFLNATFDRGANSNECDFSVGDSSGAMFIQNSGVWQLAGINYAVDGPFSNAVDGTMFEAALLDRGGLFQLNGTNWTFITNTGADSPSGFYSTRVSSHIGWIDGVISSNSPVAPVASFDATPTSAAWPLTVTFTDTSTGTVTDRFWSFGDGATTNTIANILTHTYIGPGANTVTLIVSGPAGVSTNAQANLIVVVNPPQLLVQPTSAAYGFVAVGQTSNQQFLVINAGDETLIGTAQVNSVGSPFAVTSGSPFSVGGGQTGLVSVSFSPVATGAFTDSVAFASNGGGSTNAVTGSGALAPTAGLTGAPTNGAATLLVNFTDASSGTVTSSVWAFGDGGTSTLTSPSHSYTNAGTFSVSLTVLGPLGSNTLLLANYITVTNVFGRPVAAFTASPTNGAAPLLVNFTDASTGTITNHSWNFGDGNTSAAASPSHSYSMAGVYSVALTVLGPGGSGATNQVNLITVTNVVNAPPTVSIARPANGMLYPPLTNLTITIVANATANDGGTISKIEFFADGIKLGETTSNPGTNFLVHPTLGAHIISARASDSLGLTNISAGATVTIGAKNSQLGDWEVTISGADKGAQFLTFEDDFSASGFGIRFKTFGLDDVSGHWGFTNKPTGQVTGPFIEQTGTTTNWTGTFLGPVKSLKSISGAVKTTALGTFHWRGVPATTFPDLSGTWTGLVTVVRTTPATVSFVFSPNANDSAVFDVATSGDPGTVVGQLLVTSHNKAFAYVTADGKQLRLSGTFNALRRTLTLRGTDATAERVTVKISK
jgi:PKD repeat protein